MKRWLKVLLGLALGATGAVAYTVIAVTRAEHLSAAWIVIAAACTYAIGYRFYSKWIAARLLALDDRRATPAEVHDDGKDFVRTNKWIVMGHHFAAISGPGPLVGPVLAAQFGYLPGTLWILIGVVLGGAVQDMFILVASMRRDGKSLGEMVKEEIGGFAGLVALLAIVSILVILIAVLGLVVVKALARSPWGTFTILATIPIALLMGVYLRFLRPGRVAEVTLIGVVLLLLSVWGGRYFQENLALRSLLTFRGETLAWCVIFYGLAASILPVWLLLAPRDYLSTFMKVGTILALAAGILLVLPPLSLPPLTRFIDGTGPIFAGNIFPFCFITIACGAISGFHSLVASGTTPKLIGREGHARPIGYGSMLLESAVAIMALVAAATLEPGVYFALNSPAAVVGSTPQQAVATISSWGFPVTAEQMAALAKDLGESTMFGRAGGAPTLAVGMAQVFSSIMGGRALMALWYHFAIMFEALFILTTVDAGTRVGRFLVQALLKQVYRPLGNTTSWSANLLSSVLLVSAWGYFLVQGVLDPLGGINSLWPLFGIANQLLSVIALCLATTILIKMRKTAYLWVTLLPLAWVATVTFTAAVEKIASSDPAIGFLSGAERIWHRLQHGGLTVAQSEALARARFNLQIDALVAGLFLLLVGVVLVTSLWTWLRMTRGQLDRVLAETPPVWLSEAALFEKPRRGLARAAQGLMLLIVGLSQRIPTHDHGDCKEGLAASKDADAQASDSIQSEGRQAQGRRWAEQEERRFSQPRCC